MSPNELLRAARERTASPRHPDEGLTRQELAQLVNEHIWTHHRQRVEVDALAKMGRGGETLTAVGAADDHYADRDPGSDAPWMAYYDGAQHAGDTGHALFDLALDGRSRDEARDRLATAVAGHTAGYARSRAIAQTKLATLTMVTGDPVEAATIGIEAVNTAGTLRSRRAADDLRELARYANLHAEAGEVVELCRRIRTAVLVS